MNYKELNQQLGNVDLYLLDQILKGRFEDHNKILDAGCGEGRNLKYFVNTGYEIYGVDSNQMAIKMLQMTYPQLKDNFKETLIGNLEFDDEYFDAVICSAVLHFATDKEHFLNMMDSLVRVLKPTGLLFIRMATDIGIDHNDDEFSFRLTQELIDDLPESFNLSFLEPFKTVLVDGKRSMGILVLEKGL